MIAITTSLYPVIILLIILWWLDRRGCCSRLQTTWKKVIVNNKLQLLFIKANNYILPLFPFHRDSPKILKYLVQTSAPQKGCKICKTDKYDKLSNQESFKQSWQIFLMKLGLISVFLFQLKLSLNIFIHWTSIFHLWKLVKYKM